jgi:hypothetical protein
LPLLADGVGGFSQSRTRPHQKYVSRHTYHDNWYAVWQMIFANTAKATDYKGKNMTAAAKPFRARRGVPAGPIAAPTSPLSLTSH